MTDRWRRQRDDDDDDDKDRRNPSRDPSRPPGKDKEPDSGRRFPLGGGRSDDRAQPRGVPPARPPSRGAKKDEEEKSGGLGRFLPGKRGSKDKPEDSPRPGGSAQRGTPFLRNDDDDDDRLNRPRSGGYGDRDRAGGAGDRLGSQARPGGYGDRDRTSGTGDRTGSQARPGGYGDRDRTSGTGDRTGSPARPGGFGDRDRQGGISDRDRTGGPGDRTGSQARPGGFGDRDRTGGPGDRTGSQARPGGYTPPRSPIGADDDDRPTGGFPARSVGGSFGSSPRSASQSTPYGARPGASPPADKKKEEGKSKSRFPFLGGRGKDKDDEPKPPARPGGRDFTDPGRQTGQRSAGAAGLAGAGALGPRAEPRTPSRTAPPTAKPDRRASKGRKSTPAKSRATTQAKALPQGERGVRLVNRGLDFDRKLDLIGVGLVAASLVVFFAVLPSMSLGILPSSQGGLTGTIDRLLSQLFGWGKIAWPVASFAVGLWLMVKYFGGRMFEVNYIRLVGAVILYGGVLAWMHMIEAINDPAPTVEAFRPISYSIAIDDGQGGGWFGHQIYLLLLGQLGDLGTASVLIAWVILGVILTFDVSVVDLWKMSIGALLVFRLRRGDRAQQRAAREAATAESIIPTRPGEQPIPAAAKPAAAGQQATLAPAPPGKVDAAKAPVQSPAGEPSTEESPARSQPLIRRRAGATNGDATDAETVADEASPDKRAALTTPAAGGPAPAGDAKPGSEPRPPSRRRLPHLGQTGPQEDADSTATKPPDESEARGGGRFGFLRRRSQPVDEAAAPNEAPKKDEAAASTKENESGTLPERPAPVRSPFVPASDDASPDAAPPRAPESTRRPGPPDRGPARPTDETEGTPQREIPFRRDAGRPAAGDVSPREPGESPFRRPPGETPDASRTERLGALGALGRPQPAPVRPAEPEKEPDKEPEKVSEKEDAPGRAALDAPDRIDEQKTDSTRPLPLSPAPARPIPERAEPTIPPVRPALPVRPPVKEEEPGDEDEDDDKNVLDLDEDDLDLDLKDVLDEEDEEDEEDLDALDLDEDQEDEDEPAEPVRPAVPQGILRPSAPTSPPVRTLPGPGPGLARTPDPASKPAEEAPDQPAAVPTSAPARPALPIRPTAAPDTIKPESAAPSNGDKDEAEAKPAESLPTAESTPAAAPPITPPQRVLPERPTPAAQTPPERPGPAQPTPLQARPASQDQGQDLRPTRSPTGIPLGRPQPPTPQAAIARGDNAPQARASSPTTGSERFELPDFRKILRQGSDMHINDEVLLDKARIIEDTLSSFGVPGKVVEVNPGPVITQFGVEPDYLIGRGGKKMRVKVGSIARLDADLALALAAKSIRIEAPVPGKGFVGIEVPNDETTLVSLYDIMDSPEFKKIDSRLRIALGLSVDGTPISADLTAMPHLLIAGTTGSGKSVCVNAIISCLLLSNTPEDLQFIMVDPKRVELTGYNGIPHLVAPVVVDLERIVGVLQWVQREMEERYRKFASIAARNIVDYNSKLSPGERKMPYYVVVVDELADLMMLAPDETERLLARLAQMARATGIHLIISTQRPSVDIITGLIKANFPARIAFAVASSVDSRVILDQPGAEKLLGRGDMLYQSPDAAAPLRMQGVFVSDEEINRITRTWKGLLLEEADAAGTRATLASPSRNIQFDAVPLPKTGAGVTLRKTTETAQRAFWDEGGATSDDDDDDGSDEDELYDEAVDLVQRLGKASISLLQRRLRIGYTRAARLIDMMEVEGIVGPAESGSKPREVLKLD